MEVVTEYFVWPLMVILTCAVIGGLWGWLVSRFMPNT